MKNVIAMGMLALVGAAASAQTIDFRFDQFQENNGGEFIVESSSTLNVVYDANGEFRTFCLELNEQLNQTTTFDAAVNTVAHEGGVGGGSPDPLDPRSAYLYTQFRAGTLTGYNYDMTDSANMDGITRSDSARALQLAFWALEEEITLTLDGQGNAQSLSNIVGGSSAAERALALQFIQEAIDAGWTTLGNVRVINVTSRNAQGEIVHNQDVLALVPLPGVVGMAGAGLAFVATRRRRNG
jgi:hypothetical protein